MSAEALGQVIVMASLGVKGARMAGMISALLSLEDSTHAHRAWCLLEVASRERTDRQGGKTI